MKSALQGPAGTLLGISAALISCAVVAGGVLLSLAEGGARLAPAPPSPTESLSPTLAPPPATPAPGSPTFTPSALPSPPPSPSATLPPPPQGCPPPQGWPAITIRPGDTLRNLAAAYGASQEALIEANCLKISRLIPGSILYVPPIPTAAPTELAEPTETCGPPSGWVLYLVRRGDTLFNLSQRFRVSISQLQFANCLGSSTTIRIGQRLYVPFIPPTPPLPTEASATPTPEDTATATPPPATVTPTSAPTLTPQPTQTPTLEPTQTPTTTPTNSPPTISAIPGQATSEDQPVGPIAFSVGDLETPAAQLLVTAASSNAALAPAANLLIAGAGSERTLTITPAADQSGSASITVTVTDGSGASASTTFGLSVAPVNDPPLASDDAAVTLQDTPVTINVLENDSDPEGEALSIQSLGAAASGTAAVQGAGIRYEPLTGFIGTDSFTYTIADASGGAASATVTVTVNPPSAP